MQNLAPLENGGVYSMVSRVSTKVMQDFATIYSLSRFSHNFLSILGLLYIMDRLVVGVAWSIGTAGAFECSLVLLEI